MKKIRIQMIAFTEAELEISDEMYEMIMEDGGYLIDEDLSNQASEQVEYDEPGWEVDDEPIQLIE